MSKEKVVLEAFLTVRSGRSAEHVICEDSLNQNFIAACKKSMPEIADGDCNTELLNLRKAGKLTAFPTNSRKRPSAEARNYSNCVAQAVRLLERQFSTNVDQIICIPERRCQFDALVQFLLPGGSEFEARYKALTLRKTKRLQPEVVGQIIRPTTSHMISLDEIETRSGEIPPDPGVYIFFDTDTTLYVGKADDLHRRVTEHVATWSFRELVSAVQAGTRCAAWVAFHALSVTISPREMAAYETELIRSRQPEHNRAGRVLDR